MGSRSSISEARNAYGCSSPSKAAGLLVLSVPAITVGTNISESRNSAGERDLSPRHD